VQDYWEQYHNRRDAAFRTVYLSWDHYRIRTTSVVLLGEI